MRVVTSQEMRAIDRAAIEGLGITGAVLMENAGRGVFIHLTDFTEGVEGLRALVVCGKGNNGGDGLVVARHLANHGADVRIALLGKTSEVQGDAKMNLDIARTMELPISEIVDEKGLALLADSISGSDVIVDAIFGTGFSGKAEGLYASVIDRMNSSDSPIIAIDCPSGLNVDTGRPESACIEADLTVTMALLKRGHLLYPGADLCGEVAVVDIGIPPSLVEQQKIRLATLEEDEARLLIPQRPRDAHKGDCGLVYLLAGSVGFTGAGAMAGLSALRAGAGLVTWGLPLSLNDAMEAKLTELMTNPLPETSARSLSVKALAESEAFIKKATVLALGPGISTHPETAEMVHQAVSTLTLPMVIDADGLNCLALKKGWKKDSRSELVLTPHPGEMARLLGITTEEVQKNRITITEQAAREFGATVVLKGAPTIIAQPGQDTFINTTGNPGMATAGSGDVLTGLIAGFMAQGLSGYSAAKLGVYVHGLAGDLAAKEKTEFGMISGDILDKVPEALKSLLTEDGENNI